MDAPSQPTGCSTNKPLEIERTILGLLVLAGAWWLFGPTLLAAILGCGLLVNYVAGKLGARVRLGRHFSIPACGVVGVFLAGWWLLGIGPLLTKSSWPDGLRKMASATGATDGDITAECVRANLLDYETVWAIKLPPENVPTALTACDMTDWKPLVLPGGFRGAFPPLWQPPSTRGARCFATKDFSDHPPDGDSYFGMYLPDSQTLYVWHRFHF